MQITEDANSALVNKRLRGLHNSSYHKKAEFNNYSFIIHSKYF